MKKLSNIFNKRVQFTILGAAAFSGVGIYTAAIALKALQAAPDTSAIAIIIAAALTAGAIGGSIVHKIGKPLSAKRNNPS